MSADLPFAEYGGRIVAVAGRTRFYLAVDDLDDAWKPARTAAGSRADPGRGRRSLRGKPRRELAGLIDWISSKAAQVDAWIAET